MAAVPRKQRRCWLISSDIVLFPVGNGLGDKLGLQV
jgi:hypothetical protein